MGRRTYNVRFQSTRQVKASGLVTMSVLIISYQRRNFNKIPQVMLLNAYMVLREIDPFLESTRFIVKAITQAHAFRLAMTHIVYNIYFLRMKNQNFNGKIKVL